MRASFFLPALLLLAACGPGVMSNAPLVPSGGPQPADGLWAMLDKECKAPASASIGDWPDCAMPVWLGKGIATALPNGTPNHFAFVMGDGDPHLIQLKGDMGKLLQAMGSLGGPPGGAAADSDSPETPAYFYWVFVPEGPAPFKRGKIWRLACPADEIDGLTKKAEGQDNCEATTLAALQAAGKLPAAADTVQTAVWVAPAE